MDFSGVEEIIRQKVEAAAKTAEDQLRQNLSAGSRSGRQYPNLPRRSSAPDEYPQEQFGDLKNKVGRQTSDDGLEQEVGVFDEDAGKLFGLEFGDSQKQGRAPITRTANSTELRDAIRRALNDS